MIGMGDHRQEDMLNRNIFVAHPLCFILGMDKHIVKIAPYIYIARA